VHIQLGQKVVQAHEVLNKVTMLISRPQTVYIMSIMTTQANKYVEWPPLILINYEG
jgi:hypothetical protein